MIFGSFAIFLKFLKIHNWIHLICFCLNAREKDFKINKAPLGPFEVIKGQISLINKSSHFIAQMEGLDFNI